MSAREAEPAADVLNRLWRALRDDYSNVECVQRCITFARNCGLLTADEWELWSLRVETCPGHDDEGGRSWCAYCGNMPKEPAP